MFGREFEAIIVDRLRASGDYIPGLSLVAVLDDAVAGHVMITSRNIVADIRSTIPSTILAPPAVTPAYQRQGIGRTLTYQALDAARSAGQMAMIGLGLLTYYAQFGFKHASIWGVQFVSPIPDDIFMAVALDAAALANAMSTVTLSPAFDEQ